MKKMLFLLLLCSSSIYAQRIPRVVEGKYLSNIANIKFVKDNGPGSPAISATEITPTTTPMTTAQWHFAGQQNDVNSAGSSIGASSKDWIYSMVTTNRKETIACGFGNNSLGRHSGTIFKLNNKGQMVWSKAIAPDPSTSYYAYKYDFSSSTSATPVGLTSIARNDLWSIEKCGNEYVAVGRGNGILVVVMDEDGNFIKGTPIDVIPPSSPTQNDGTVTMLSSPGGDGYSVAVDPNATSVTDVIVGGIFRDVSTSYTYGGFLKLKYDAGAGTWSLGDSYYGGLGGSSIHKILTKSTSSTTYDIYACGSISAAGDNAPQPLATNDDGATFVSLTTYNKDIWVVKTNNTFSPVISQSYNKHNILVNTPSGISDITTYGPDTYPYQEVGPLSARNYAPGTGRLGSIRMGVSNFVYDFSSDATVPLNAQNNENEVGIDMTFTADNKIALITMVNLIGSNIKNALGYTPANIVSNTNRGGAHPYYVEYVDGDAFLLKLNTNLTLDAAKNVAHFSGQDYFPQIRQDPEGYYIVTGSSADLFGTFGSGGYSASNDVNLQQADIVNGFDNAMLVITDNDFSATGRDLARRCFAASDPRATDVGPGGADNMQDAMTCVFAMDLTADGGYLIGGNNSNNRDDYTVTKFAPVHQQLMKAGIGGSYATFGATSIPVEYDITGATVWNSNMNVASRVVVKSGGTLTIDNCTISFAASDHIWDYSSAADANTGSVIGCGIVVEPGGKLIIQNHAVLKGINGTNEHNMWDGIVVQGVPATLPHTTVYNSQGNAKITNAKIQDARYGLYVSDNYRTYTKVGSTNYADALNDFTGFTYGSRYNGYATYGGGIVTADHVDFLNCRFGVNFQNAPNNSNSSVFEYCSFNSDATGMGDICFYTNASGSALPANTHFAAWNVKGMIALHSNTLTCSPTFATDMRPAGIIANTTRMDIAHVCSALYATPCMETKPGNTFTNLAHAIIASNPPGVAPAVYINNNYFDNNGNGVEASGIQNGLVITENEFHINGNYLFIPDPNVYDHPTGVTLAGCHAYDVSANTFDKCVNCTGFESLLQSRGIVVNNGGTDEETIERNTFNQIHYGVIAAQENGNDPTITGSSAVTGLQFHCNTFNNSYVDITRSSVLDDDPSVVPAVIRPEQGECLTFAGSPVFTKPAGNQFNSACVSGGGHLLVEDGFVTQVVTYNNNRLGSEYDPSYLGGCYNSSLYDNHSCILTGVVPPLPVTCPEPGGYIVVNVVKWLAELGAVEIAIRNTQDPDVELELKNRRYALVSRISRYYSLSNEPLAAAALLHTYERYSEALPFYLMADLPLMAQLMYSKMPKKTEEQKLYAKGTELAINLYSHGKSWMDLDADQRAAVRDVTQYNSPTGYMAGGINMLLGTGTVTWPVPAMDTTRVIDTTARVTGSGIESNDNSSMQPITNVNNNAAAFSIYPNPTFGNFTIKASASGKFTLYTMVGQEVQTYAIIAGQTALKVPGLIAAGVYMGLFRPDDGGKPKEVKIVFQQ